MKSFNKFHLQNDIIERKAIGKEMDILRSIKHPNLMKLVECYEDEQKIYICNELLFGGELMKKYFEKHKLDENQVSNYMLQLLQALEYLSQQNIMHRDIKPENLLLKDVEGT